MGGDLRCHVFRALARNVRHDARILPEYRLSWGVIWREPGSSRMPLEPGAPHGKEANLAGNVTKIIELACDIPTTPLADRLM